MIDQNVQIMVGGNAVTTENPVPVKTELPAVSALSDAADNPITTIIGAAELVYNGSKFERKRTPNVFKTIAAQAVTAETPVDLWTPASGKKFRLMGYALSLSVAGSVILKDDTTEIIRTPLMDAGIGVTGPNLGNGILSAVADNKLKADVTATGTISGFVFGCEE